MSTRGMFSFIFLAVTWVNASAQQTGHGCQSNLSIQIEGSAALDYYNSTRQPSATGTEIRLDKAALNAPVVFNSVITYSPGPKHEWRFSYSPFINKGSFVPMYQVNFDQVSFAAGEQVDTKYIFNLYRATYVYHGFTGFFKNFQLGVTLAIRQGSMQLQSISARRQDSDWIAVPLVYLGWQKEVYKNIYATADANFLAIPIGFVSESSASIMFSINDSIHAGVKYRILAGGVEVPNVKNNLTVQTIGLSAKYLFNK